jgi:hypothetical protein
MYYPLWVLRYRYHNRIYQVTADGESGEILYGRAPGNLWYRIFWLAATTAAGNFILTSYIRSLSAEDEIEPLIAIVIGAAVLIYFGFRKLRYGGEVKKQQKMKYGQDVIRKLYGKQEIAKSESLPSMIQSLLDIKGLTKNDRN